MNKRYKEFLSEKLNMANKFVKNKTKKKKEKKRAQEKALDAETHTLVQTEIP